MYNLKHGRDRAPWQVQEGITKSVTGQTSYWQSMIRKPTFASHPSAARKSSIEDAPQLEVVIEIPRGSFLKRGSIGRLDFISPFPCPFNYGSVEAYVGCEGDLLDAVVLGPRLRRGTRITVQAFGAVGLMDRGMYDDKLICSDHPIEPVQRFLVLLFFQFYAQCKGLLNLFRGRSGRNHCEGWGDAKAAIARAKPREDAVWKGPPVPF
jgi:inorganic pyrophosphatase